ncbi:hypothetical protein N657DRAFT_561834 [Parathielavia appendiculata]|uniref:Uncharacterized protein n=1 Tax=Parathielavia appendiculata TaxID=2587402 RepID=A0AAN6UB28_9PEZI|nr:hypothetical protein N657DRAFT_561834 [Parathielavia appendiculata]
MRNKLMKSRPHLDQKPPFSTHRNDQHKCAKDLSSAIVVPIENSPAAASAATPTKPSPSKAPSPSHERPSPRPTLISQAACEGTTNATMSRTTTGEANGKAAPSTTSSLLSPRIPNRMNSTIRTVPSFDDRQAYPEDDSSIDGVQSHSTSRDSGFSSSLNSTTSMGSAHSQQRAQAPSGGISRIPSHNKLKPSPSGASQDNGDGTPDGTPKTSRTIPSSAEIPPRESSLNASSILAPTITSTDPGGGGVGGGSSANDVSLSATEANTSNSWDSSVGKAGLGKTGRVINRLVSDNEALKRDIQIERLRAEESRNAARLLEDKLERVISDYESRLLEASVTKTLLARKERQVESLQDAVELERKRALDAAARERVWKDEMEKTKADAKRRVDDATNYAALCEGRYNAISSHWKDQGEEVKRAMGRMRAEVEELVGEREKDDEKIETLRELCDQQDGNIRELRRQKEEIAAQFERYKKQQEEDLRDIKRRADEREREQERTLREAREVLDKLRWALSVKEKIEWAQ